LHEEPSVTQTLNRRQFIATSSFAVAAGALRGLPAFAQEPETSFETLRGGVGIFNGAGGTIGWLVSPDGTVAVDSQFANTAQICVDGLRERSERGIDILINTHHHGDHTAGNRVFQGVVKHIVAHSRVPELQRRAAEEAGTEADQAYANVTFVENWRIHLGAEIVSARHYGPGHTGGDIVVHFENANVVHMGDLMFNRVHPRIDRPSGASIANWITTLEQVADNHTADTTFVFGHGHSGFGVVGESADLLHQRDYFTAVLDHARAGIAAGQSVEEITALESLPGFDDHGVLVPRLSLASVLTDAHGELSE
jgi:glyoxylase-like metal-dependent hydrolase (beta-lactamase superfamily II)|tara:strand:- start:30 stop:959 length:930 start_codon:yes stop_codon:yes gene_type:complete